LADLFSGQKVVSVELSCDEYTYLDTKLSDGKNNGCTAFRYNYGIDGKLALMDKSGGTPEDFSNFPYVTSKTDTEFDAITNKAGLANATTRLNWGCYADTNSIQTATVINCVFGNFTDTTPDRASFKTSKADLKVWHTDIIPVNLWIIGQDAGKNPALDLDNSKSQGGIYNADETLDGWRNLKIFGYNSSSNIYLADDIPDGNNDCTKQTAKLGKSGRNRPSGSRYFNKSDTEGIIDGAFMWFPNANIQVNNLNSRTTPYFVLWACQITGAKSLSSASAIFTPLSRLGVNAGISGVFNINGGATGRTSYRAYGSKGTTTDDN
jgi:hypothetical protein